MSIKTALLSLCFAITAMAQTPNKNYFGQLNIEGTPGEYVTGGRTYNLTHRTGRLTAEISNDKTQMEIRYDDYNMPDVNFAKRNFVIEFQAIRGETLHKGKYKSAIRYPFNRKVEYSADSDIPARITYSNGFNFAGMERICSQLTADFTINILEFDPTDNRIEKLEVDFVQYCENGTSFAKGLLYLTRTQGVEFKIRQ